MSQSLLVVTKDEEKGAKGISAMKIQSYSLSPKTTKDEFVTLLKVIDDRPLFIMFLRSQRKFLETKGIINQFTKMDVKKFKELMKFTLANHSVRAGGAPLTPRRVPGAPKWARSKKASQ